MRNFLFLSFSETFILQNSLKNVRSCGITLLIFGVSSGQFSILIISWLLLSLNPNPTETKYIKETPNFGFKTINKEKDLFDLLENLLSNELNYFSAMLSKQELGNIIKIASKEKSNEEIASKFLE